MKLAITGHFKLSSHQAAVICYFCATHMVQISLSNVNIRDQRMLDNLLWALDIQDVRVGTNHGWLLSHLTPNATFEPGPRRPQSQAKRNKPTGISNQRPNKKAKVQARQVRGTLAERIKTNRRDTYLQVEPDRDTTEKNTKWARANGK